MMSSYSSGVSVVLLYILYTRVPRSYFVANMDTNAATCVLVIICSRVVTQFVAFCVYVRQTTVIYITLITKASTIKVIL